MARQPTGRRPPQEEAPDDAFIARVLQLSTWVQNNLRTVIIGAMVLAVAVAGVLYYRNHQQQLRTQANIELMNLRMMAASQQVDDNLVLTDLQRFVARYDGTRAADEARLMLAQRHLTLGQADEAAAAVQSLARRPNTPLGASAAFLLAAAHEQQERFDDAEAVYLRIADDADMGFQRREALDHAARIRLERTDAAGAVELYERLVASAPDNAMERSIYEMRLAEARTRAQQRPASPPASN